MVEGARWGDDRLLASPLGVAADLCGGLRPPRSHRVAAGSTPSPSERHTKGPLFVALSIPGLRGCTALSPPQGPLRLAQAYTKAGVSLQSRPGLQKTRPQ